MSGTVGRLSLIGCGPGAVDLLTLRAVRCIGAADVVLRDRLVHEDVLTFARADAQILYVGKGCGDGGRQQKGINGVIRDALKAGRHVARLKSGDPLVFGRAAEELAVAVELGAEVNVVPGVTAALAAAADANVLLTERQEIQSFVVTTGRSTDDGVTPDWAHLLKPGVCLAFYMGVAQAWRIQSQLMAAGAPGAAPISWVENAGRPECRAVHGRLDGLARTAREGDVMNPAILLVRYPLSLAGALGGEGHWPGLGPGLAARGDG